MDKKVEIEQFICPKDLERYDRQLYHLKVITKKLVEFVNDKDTQYGSSWRKRGGAGAFMVIARKWDRIEQACENEPVKYDIFNVFESDDRKETILDDCLDLVGYLLILVEHMVELGVVTKIEGLNMSFKYLTKSKPKKITGYDPATKTCDPRPAWGAMTGMESPFGFDEKEDVPND